MEVCVEALAAVDTGMFANSVVDENGDVISAGMVGHAEQLALHVRRLNGATGTPAFDVVDTDVCCADWSLTEPGLRHHDDCTRKPVGDPGDGSHAASAG